jgi:hypothetical protein
MTRRPVTWFALCLSLVGCMGGTSNQSPGPTAEGPVPTGTAVAPSSAAPSTTASSASGGTTLVLNEAPANMGCDTIGIDYKTMTFDIDPDAMDHVTAETDTGVTLKTYWSAGFQPGTSADLVVRDPTGAVVVNNGGVLQVPPGAYPRLHGYFVCLAPDKLYVLLTDPS